jgi:regulator of sigma E protease
MNVTLLTWVVFILAFGGMVLIHEFGHFIAARISKIEVDEFGIGLPTPGAITLFYWKGTRFTLNWLPLGGFVRPKGENDPNVPGGLAAASPWKRLFVLVAGPAMNLLTAVVIYAIIFSQIGVPIPGTGRVMVNAITDGSPAAVAGFKSGDIFVSGNGQPIDTFDQLRVIVDGNADKPVHFVVERDGKQVELTATPRMNESAKKVMIGIEMTTMESFRKTSSWLETLNLGIRTTGYSIRTLIALPAQLLRGTAAPEASRFIGLKGIFDILGQSVSHDVQAASNPSPAPSIGSGSAPVSSNPMDKPVLTLQLLASLSISLGVFNLLPFPALDGGRIIFLLPELIFRRRVSPQVENVVHAMGMALLLIFMLYVNAMDFINPINMKIP